MPVQIEPHTTQPASDAKVFTTSARKSLATAPIWRRAGLILLVLLLAGTASTVAAHRLARPSLAPQAAASLPLLHQMGGSAYGVALQGQKAYLGLGPRLLVFDVSEPAAPILLGRTEPLPDGVSDIVVAGDVAYVNLGGSLGIVDVADPAAMTMVSGHDTPGTISDLALSQNHIYITEHEDWDGSDWIGGGLRVIDVSDPAMPIEIAYLDSDGSAYSVAVSGAHAYLGCGCASAYQLVVIDISTPSVPVPISRLYLSDNAQGLTIDGNYLYAAMDEEGLAIYDLADPAMPSDISFLDTPGTALAVSIAGSRAYIADGTGGLRIIDVSDKAAPFEENAYEIPGPTAAWDVAGNLDHAFVAYGSDGFVAVSAADASPVAAYDPLGFARNVATGGDHLYVLDSYDGLRIYSLNNPAEVGHYASGASFLDLALNGDHAYLVDPGRLVILDVANPAMPALESTLNIPSSGYAIALAGNYAYIANGSSGLTVVDISDPQTPAIVGSLTGPGNANNIAVAGDYAYVADTYAGLRIIDITDPATPALAATFPIANTTGAVAAGGDYAYLGEDYAGVHIVDVSDPLAPIGVALYPLEWEILDIQIAGTTLYISGAAGGFAIVDVSTPAAPALVGIYDTSDYAWASAAADAAVYVADGGGGLLVIEASRPETLAAMPMQYQLDNGDSGALTLWFLADRTFVDDLGRQGTWQVRPTQPRLIMQYEPGAFCDALLVGRVSASGSVQGRLRCDDGSGVEGVWMGELDPVAQDFLLAAAHR